VSRLSRLLRETVLVGTRSGEGESNVQPGLCAARKAPLLRHCVLESKLSAACPHALVRKHSHLLAHLRRVLSLELPHAKRQQAPAPLLDTEGNDELPKAADYGCIVLPLSVEEVAHQRSRPRLYVASAVECVDELVSLVILVVCILRREISACLCSRLVSSSQRRLVDPRRRREEHLTVTPPQEVSCTAQHCVLLKQSLLR
jgi:hypothetical protein